MNIYSIPSLSNKNFDILLYNYLCKSKVEGNIIEGKIVNISKENIFVDIGLKTEGKIARNEFADTDTIEIGTKTHVYFNSFEGNKGCIELSKRDVYKRKLWDRFYNLSLTRKSVSGKIIAKVSKGGFAVSIGGLLAFLPRSQLDTRNISDISTLINIVQPFKILKIDVEHGNIVVSRRAVIEELRQTAKITLLSGIREKMIFQGIAKNITDYGVFVDLGDIDGLLHITDISWQKISHPSEKINLGQKLRVMVIKFDNKTKRISLGIKQLFVNPWQKINRSFSVGNKYLGKIISLSDRGVSVELKEGVEGWVGLSEVSWNNNVDINSIFKLNQIIQVLLLDINLYKNRISLSIKQCISNPWQHFINIFPTASIIDFKVTEVSQLGFLTTVKNQENYSYVSFILPFSEILWEDSSYSSVQQVSSLNLHQAIILRHELTKYTVFVSVKRLEMVNYENNFLKLKSDTAFNYTLLYYTFDGFYAEITSVNLIVFVKNIGVNLSVSYNKNNPNSIIFNVYDRKRKLFYMRFRNPS